jgi:hypothetical protein
VPVSPEAGIVDPVEQRDHKCVDVPAVTCLACGCLTMAIAEGRFELTDIVTHWRSFRRLANRVLAKAGPVGVN